MTQYIVDSANQQTESMLIDYHSERGGVQAIAGQMYAAIHRAENAYVAFEEMLNGGRLAPLAEYHAAKQAPITDAVVGMRAQMADLLATMRAMQASMPDGIVLFPGVPRETE
jgi:hypothetical protein